MPDDSKTVHALKISEPSLRRLPVYYQYLKKIGQDAGQAFISCTQIAHDLELTPIQVRKDLEAAEVAGKPKVGYDIALLIGRIEDFLGWNNATDAYLVGAGNLGSALLGYQGFKDYGLNIVAAFDADESKVGREIMGKKVLHIKKLPEMIRRMSIKIGILTSPASAAQELADSMIEAGIRAIWNFAPVRISAPGHIIVQHENLASSLAVLSKRLAMTFSHTK